MLLLGRSSPLSPIHFFVSIVIVATCVFGFDAFTKNKSKALCFRRASPHSLPSSCRKATTKLSMSPTNTTTTTSSTDQKRIITTKRKDRVKSFMTTPCLSIPPTMSLDDAAQLLVSKSISGLPVVENNKLIGIISQFDFLPKEAGATSLDLSSPSYVKDVTKIVSNCVRTSMTPNPVRITEDSSMQKAASEMVKMKVNRLPVVNEGGDLVGVLSSSDVMRHLSVLMTTDEEEGQGEVEQAVEDEPGSFSRVSQEGDDDDDEEVEFSLDRRKDTVKYSMTSPCTYVTPDMSLDEAGELFVANKIAGAPVVDPSTLKVVGVLSQFDFLAKEAGTMALDMTSPNYQQNVKKIISKMVKSSMSSNPIVVTEDITMQAAATMMVKKKLNRLPVVDGEGKLVGLLSSGDVMRHLVKSPGGR